MELGRLRREVTAVEPLGEERRLLLHELASREVCGFDGCPSRMRAREHGRGVGVVHPIHDDGAVMDGAPGLGELVGVVDPAHDDGAVMDGEPGNLQPDEVKA